MREIPQYALKACTMRELIAQNLVDVLSGEGLVADTSAQWRLMTIEGVSTKGRWKIEATYSSDSFIAFDQRFHSAGGVYANEPPPVYPRDIYFWIEFTPSDTDVVSWLELLNANPHQENFWDDLKAATPSFVHIYDIAKKDDAYSITVFFGEKEPTNSHEVEEWALEVKKKTFFAIASLLTVISVKWLNANYGHLREKLET